MLRTLLLLLALLATPSPTLSEVGQPFLPHDPDRLGPQMAYELNLGVLHEGYDADKYLDLVRLAGAPAHVTSLHEFAEYVDSLTVIDCPADRFADGVYYAVGTDSYGTFVRSPHPGEQCGYDPATEFLFTFYCGNPIAKAEAEPVTFKMGVLRHCIAPCSYTHQGGSN